MTSLFVEFVFDECKATLKVEDQKWKDLIQEGIHALGLDSTTAESNAPIIYGIRNNSNDVMVLPSTLGVRDAKLVLNDYRPYIFVRPIPYGSKISVSWTNSSHLCSMPTSTTTTVTCYQSYCIRVSF